MTDQECMECGLSAAGAASAAAWDAELAERDKSIIAASNAADKAEQNHKRCIAQVESLRRELSKMTAEAGRLREALVIVSSSADDCMLSHGENLCCIRESGLVRIAEAALSPEPEKPAPKKLSDHLPGCAALTTHDKDCDCSPAPDGEGRKEEGGQGVPKDVHQNMKA